MHGFVQNLWIWCENVNNYSHDNREFTEEDINHKVKQLSEKGEEIMNILDCREKIRLAKGLKQGKIDAILTELIMDLV